MLRANRSILHRVKSYIEVPIIPATAPQTNLVLNELLCVSFSPSVGLSNAIFGFCGGGKQYCRVYCGNYGGTKTP